MATVINIAYEDLLAGKDLTAQIEQGYGPDGLGVITVSGIPNVAQYRLDLLTLARKFANLPDAVKEKYVDAKSNYSFGWSHGKEQFGGKLDVLKGSFYNNPQYDVPTEDANLVKQFPFYCCPNIWPKQEIPELETSFKKLGNLMVHVGMLLAKQVDAYTKKVYNGSEKFQHLYDTIATSKCAKARLLYYFPMNDSQIDAQMKDSNADSWCGWHLDHGSLTALTSAIFEDDKGNLIQDFKDEAAGLYIRNRHGEVVKAKWSPDRLAFQIGESAQIHSGGKVVATPHCVRGTTQPGVSRSTFALFMQPQWDTPMVPAQGATIEDCKMPVLQKDMDFNHFTIKRLAEYYNM